MFYLTSGPIDQRQVVVHRCGKNGLQMFRGMFGRRGAGVRLDFTFRLKRHQRRAVLDLLPSSLARRV